MKKYVMLALGHIGPIVGIGLLAGFLVFVCYPFVIPAVFPGLVKITVLAEKIDFWVSVFLCLLIETLMIVSSFIKKMMKES